MEGALSFIPMGTIGANGALEFYMTVPNLPAGEEGGMIYYQALLSDASGPRYLSNPSGMVILDSSF